MTTRLEEINLTERRMSLEKVMLTAIGTLASKLSLVIHEKSVKKLFRRLDRGNHS